MDQVSKNLKYYKTCNSKRLSKATENLIKKNRRQSARISSFNQNRNISLVIEPSTPNDTTKKPKTRKQKLLEWKEQKKRKEEAEKANKKPAFKFCRCPTKFEDTISDFKKTTRNQYQNVRSKTDTNLKKDNKILDTNYQFKIPNLSTKTKKISNIPPSSIVTRGRLKRMNAVDLDVFPIQEISLKKEDFFSAESTSITSFIEAAGIKSPTPEKSETKTREKVKDGKYFETLLDSEITRLQSYCTIWETYIAETDLSSDIRDEIECVICQTRLLIRNKFEQFRNLTRGISEKQITSDDLQGFWDMMYIQVHDLDKRFDRLKERKENSWFENLSSTNAQQKINSEIVPTVVKPKKKATTASLEIRQAMAAARKKMQEMKLSQDVKESSELQINNLQEEESSNNPQINNPKDEECSNNPQPEKFRPKNRSVIKDLLKCHTIPSDTKDAIVFDAGFFSVVSPHKVRSPKITTFTKRESILTRSVERKARISSPGLFMIGASRIAKLTEN